MMGQALQGVSAPSAAAVYCEFYVLSKRSLILALLIGHSARGLAGRLAGGLALAAAAVGSALLERGTVKRLYMLHCSSLLKSEIMTERL